MVQTERQVPREPQALAEGRPDQLVPPEQPVTPGQEVEQQALPGMWVLQALQEQRAMMELQAQRAHQVPMELQVTPVRMAPLALRGQQEQQGPAVLMEVMEL